jgi:hypothetical protein
VGETRDMGERKEGNQRDERKVLLEKKRILN